MKTIITLFAVLILILAFKPTTEVKKKSTVTLLASSAAQCKGYIDTYTKVGYEVLEVKSEITEMSPKYSTSNIDYHGAAFKREYLIILTK